MQNLISCIAWHGPTGLIFDNNRPIVLYNPHFSAKLSSWPLLGERALQYFAHQARCNLIFAPHYRLFDKHRQADERLMCRYAHLGHILIDTGSPRSTDMTYTLADDLYLGNFSSQVAEFLIRPRPFIIFNAHHVNWQSDQSYYCWNRAEVLE